MMDNRFRARLLRAFKRGKESRQAAANQTRSRLLVGEIIKRSLKLRRCRLGLLGSPLPRLLLVLALLALADEFGPRLTLPTAHASRALSNARWRTCWSAGHAIEQRLRITTGKKPKRCPPAARCLMSSIIVVAIAAQEAMRSPHHHGRLVANNRHDRVMLANIGVHDEAHRGFRAIHKMNNIRSLSEVIWGNSQVMRWRHCWQVGTTSGQ